MRVRKKHWANRELETNKFVVKEPANLKGKWNAFFNNSNCIHVEIGCGKGGFISQMANLNTNINYIGIERQTSIIAVAARAADKSLQNIAFINGDAYSLDNFFENGEITRIYINFCDPWPKKKWGKRRLTHCNFLNIYKSLFQTEGEIFFKTDNQKLFEFSLNQFSDCGFKLSNITFDLHNSDLPFNIMTEYEQKFACAGLPIYRCEGCWKKH